LLSIAPGGGPANTMRPSACSTFQALDVGRARGEAFSSELATSVAMMA